MGRLSQVKYLEELKHGDTFTFEDSIYVVTTDFRSRKDSWSFLCVKLKTGQVSWLNGNTIVDLSPIYSLDEDNNIVAIKPIGKDNG